jgi:hypothetical protein
MQDLPPDVRAEFEERSERLFWRQAPIAIAVTVAFFVSIFYFFGGGWRAFYPGVLYFAVWVFFVVLWILNVWVSYRWWVWYTSGEPILGFRTLSRRRVEGIVLALVGLCVMGLSLLFAGVLFTLPVLIIGSAILGIGILIARSGVEND